MALPMNVAQANVLDKKLLVGTNATSMKQQRVKPVASPAMTIVFRRSCCRTASSLQFISGDRACHKFVVSSDKRKTSRPQKMKEKTTCERASTSDVIVPAK